MNFNNYNYNLTPKEEFGTEHIRLDQRAINRTLETDTLVEHYEQAQYKITATEDEQTELEFLLSELSEPLKKVYKLLYIEGLDQNDAAKELNVSQATLSRKNKRMIQVLQTLKYDRNKWSNVNRSKCLTPLQKEMCADLRKHYCFQSITDRYNHKHKTGYYPTFVIKQIEESIKKLSKYPKHQQEMAYIRQNHSKLSNK